MRVRLAALFVVIACGDSGGTAATTTSTDPQTTAAATTTGTSTSTSTGTTADAPTGSGSADASSGGATGPDPTTGAVLTATGDMTTDDTTSTTGTTGTTADDTTTNPLPECDGADVAAILDAFIECPSPGYLGQTKPISGVTCWDICCAFGILNCGFRAAQADFDACNPMNARPSGDCSDEFHMQWSSQCNCLN